MAAAARATQRVSCLVHLSPTARAIGSGIVGPGAWPEDGAACSATLPGRIGGQIEPVARRFEFECRGIATRGRRVVGAIGRRDRHCSTSDRAQKGEEENRKGRNDERPRTKR